MVDFAGGKDLIPVNLWECHRDSIFEIAKKINEKVLLCKNNQNKDHNEITKIFTLLPTYLLGFLTSIGSYLA